MSEVADIVAAGQFTVNRSAEDGASPQRRVRLITRK